MYAVRAGIKTVKYDNLIARRGLISMTFLRQGGAVFNTTSISYEEPNPGMDNEFTKVVIYRRYRRMKFNVTGSCPVESSRI